MKRFVAVLCAAFVAVLLIVPAFGIVADGVPEDRLTLTLPASDNAQENGIMCVERFGGRHLEHYFSALGPSPVYFSVVFTRSQNSWDSPTMVDGVPASNSSGRFIFFSEAPFVLYHYKKDLSKPSESGSSTYESSIYGEESDSPFYYYSTLRLPDTFSYSGYFNQTANAWYEFQTYPFNSLTDLRAWMANPPAPLIDKSVSIPIGYAAYFKASGTLKLRCTFPSNSNLVSTGHGWWGETRQTLGSADLLPSDSFQPSGVQIVWARDSALSALGVLGTTKHAYSEHVAMSPWTVIVNPVNKYLALGSDQNTRDSYNGPITVSGMIGEFRLYPLAGSWSPSTGLEDDGSGSEYIDVNIDPETGEPVYTDPDGNVVTPPAPGGSTALPEAVSSTSLVQRIVGILSDLVNRIEGIFSVAYQAISNLVGLAGPFVAKLSALYSWLPAPVLSALSSAMILAITIGVLKVFL